LRPRRDEGTKGMRIRFRRRGLRLGLLSLLIGGVMLTLLVGSSAATPTATTFTYTGGEQTYSVPAGATAVTITAVGAPGGHGFNGGAAGYGAVVTATVPLSSGTTTLYVEVGGVGASPVCDGTVYGSAFNGGGQPTCGAGGGGASDVRLDSATSTALTATDSRLVVAGGGGGSAVGDSCGGGGGTAGDMTASGAGDGGSGSQFCPPATSTVGSDGGLGGTYGSGGSNFDYPGGDGGNGSLGQGGHGGGPQGAGGGGGYFGGGGGGAGETGAGGGAGSSFWIAGASGTSMTEDTTGTPSVSITPVFPPPCTLTGYYRDGNNLTAKQIGGDVTGTLDATGCNIGVYYGPSTSGTVSGANISGANYYGVVDNAGSVNISNSSIHDIGETQPNGSQHGVGVLYTTLNGNASCNACVISGPHATGTLSGSSITHYQKNGVVISGAGAAATAQSNTVTGYGMINYIAQNGIEVASGASALIKGNTVSGNWYTPTPVVACGLLFIQAGGVKQSSNNLFNNEVNLCNAGRGGGNYKP
jgi:hypothetical protein